VKCFEFKELNIENKEDREKQNRSMSITRRMHPPVI